jgi:hypothetical protein
MLAENYTNMISLNVYEVSEIRNVYSSPNIDNMFKIRKMRVAVQETHRGEKEKFVLFKILFVYPINSLKI